MGDCLQVHVFGDPGMEMMPECNGCMCYKRGKQIYVFEWFHFSHLFTDLVSRGKDLDDMLVSFGDPGVSFSDFQGPGARLEILWFSSGTLGGPRLRWYTRWVVESTVRGVQ